MISVFLSIVVLGIISYLTSWAYLFPSIGPSVLMVFYFPSSPISAPRNVILGHLSGIILGSTGYALAQLVSFKSSALAITFSSAISMGLFALFMAATGVFHPPAAASCLIASLGLLRGWPQAVGMLFSVIVICGVGYVINKVSGVEYPLWNPTSKVMLPRIKILLGDLEELESDDPVKRIAAKLAMRQKLED